MRARALASFAHRGFSLRLSRMLAMALDIRSPGPSSSDGSSPSSSTSSPTALSLTYDVTDRIHHLLGFDYDAIELIRRAYNVALFGYTI
jgi:hypothetical protein